MVITDEIKFPGQPVVDNPGKKRRVEKTGRITPVLPIKRFWRKWHKQRDRIFIKGVEANLPQGSEKMLQLLIDKVNQNFLAHHIEIHLALVKTGNGYELDIYDCTGNRVCQLIRGNEIHLDDLPNLLRKLQSQSGILIDTVS
jgi:hypothetical protein